MELVCSFNMLFYITCRLIWLQGNAFVLAIEPILCCRLILSTRSTLQARTTVTEFTTTGIAALEMELKGYHDNRSPACRHHLDSMGLPRFPGQSTANPVVNSLLGQH